MKDEWTPWIKHDDRGWPQGLTRDEIVIADISGDIMSPMPAGDIDWRCPSDPVLRFRRARHPQVRKLLRLVQNLPAPTERVDA